MNTVDSLIFLNYFYMYSIIYVFLKQLFDIDYEIFIQYFRHAQS